MTLLDQETKKSEAASCAVPSTTSLDLEDAAAAASARTSSPSAQLRSPRWAVCGATEAGHGMFETSEITQRSCVY